VPASGTAASTTTTTSGTTTTKPALSRTTKLALTRAHRGTSGGDPALPIVLVTLLIGLIGAAAWFRWRQRPAQE
jgi:hypothetical protein